MKKILLLVLLSGCNSCDPAIMRLERSSQAYELCKQICSDKNQLVETFDNGLDRGFECVCNKTLLPCERK
jgi:hypothetical protein